MRAACGAEGEECREGDSVTADPKLRLDGCCAQCGGPRRTTREEAHSNGTRLPREVWLGHLERDPFCSSECARAWHDCVLPDTLDGRDRGCCIDCGKEHHWARNRNAGPRCAVCADKEKRANDTEYRKRDAQRHREARARRRVADPEWVERERVRSREKRAKQRARLAAEGVAAKNGAPEKNWEEAA